MIVVFTHPEKVLHEQEKISGIMQAHSNVLVHVRKPSWEKGEIHSLLNGLDNSHYSRIVLHQHTELAAAYGLKGGHTKDGDRSNRADGHISTSVHSMEDARKYGELYDYFFCSPVFPSISKIGYSCNENWDINGETEAFRKKAVALGGIDASRLEELKRLGFRNYAFLGAVWYKEDPVQAFTELAGIFDQ